MNELTPPSRLPEAFSDSYSFLEEPFARIVARAFSKRPLSVGDGGPLISFTFDDFPRSAWTVGGGILGRFGVRGTYYVSLGLMGKEGPPGAMFLLEDLRAVVEQGHELGCHTFDHYDSWSSPPGVYEKSIIKNQLALDELFPGALFRTFAYPRSMPRLAVKRVSGRRFLCCRGGARRRINIGTIDLSLLSVNFLEKRRDDPAYLRSLIERTQRERGWLIFATHDVSANPSPYGCIPELFEKVVRWSVESGSRILPVVEAYRALTGEGPQ